MQAISTGESVNPDLAFNLYQRLASGEYNIVSVCYAHFSFFPVKRYKYANGAVLMLASRVGHV